MIKVMYDLLKVLGISLLVISCTRGSDSIEEDNNNNNGNTQSNSVSIISSKTQVPIDTTVKLELSYSISQGINNVNWDFGDGNTYYGDSSTQPVYHKYAQAGNYSPKVTLLLSDGTSITKSITLSVTNTNMLKINKVTVQNIPYKTNNVRWVNAGTSGYWQTFTGDWDESKSYGTINPDVYADIYLDFSKIITMPDPNNPHILLTSTQKYITSTWVQPNEINKVFDVSNLNIVMGYTDLQYLLIKIMDSDSANSLLENGSTDDEIAEVSISALDFVNSSATFSGSGLSYKIEFEK